MTELDLGSAPDVEVTEPITPPMVLVTLTCHTGGCPNQGVPVQLEIPQDTSYAYCGACGERITDAAVTT